LSIFFIFYKPIEIKNNIKRNYLDNLILYVKTISPYILISIFVWIITFTKSIYLIDIYFFIIWLFFIFFIYIWIYNIFNNKKLNDIEKYKYIKTTKKEKKHAIKYFITTFLILISFLYISFNTNEDIFNLILLTWSYISLIWFVDNKYKIITDRITTPLILALFYYLLFIIDNSVAFLPFSYLFLWITLSIISLFDYIYSRINQYPINILWFSDPYILYILLLFLSIQFIPFLFIMVILLKIKTIIDVKKNIIKKDYPLFKYLFFVYLMYLFWIINMFNI
jgi:hypothetical protein